MSGSPSARTRPITAARGRADWHGAAFCERRSKAEEPLSHGILVPVIANAFKDLAVGASLWRNGLWEPIHGEPNLLRFEMATGAVSQRFVYNDRSIERVQSRGVTVVGQHAGFQDFFVPVGTSRRVSAVLVTGPFAARPLTSAQILERWHDLTGRQGHPSDPEFLHYLSVALSTPLFGGEQKKQLRRMLECFSALMVGAGTVERVVVEAERLWNELLAVRLAERCWEAATEMVDERTSHVWSHDYRTGEREALGLTRLPERALVGLFGNRRRDVDPVEDLVRRHALQRACVDLAMRFRDVVCGRIGEHGVSFLSAQTGSARRVERALLELGDAASSLARRRYGLGLHLGLSSVSGPLPAQYRAALAAAESALSHDVAVVTSDAVAPVSRPLSKLRQELARLVVDRPAEIAPRFESYIEAVAARSGYRVEAIRAQLEAGFERMVDSLVESDAIEAKDLDTLTAGVERATESAGTVAELFSAYRCAARDIADAVTRPTTAHHERSLRRADAYLGHHYTEPVSLQQVARVAGFAANYFSVLFQKAHGMTFREYLTRLRIQRAQALLADTALGLERVAQLAGFGRRQHLGRVFRRTTGETPEHYRRRVVRASRPERS